MEDFFSGPVICFLFAAVLLLVYVLWSIKNYHYTQSELARYDNFINEHTGKPIQGEVKYSTVFVGEYGADVQLFETGTITFDDGRTFCTESERAFDHIVKCCEANPNFAVQRLPLGGNT